MLRNFVPFFALGGVATASAAYLIYHYYRNRTSETSSDMLRNFGTFFALGGVAASTAYYIYRYYSNRASRKNVQPQKSIEEIYNMMNRVLENIDEEELKMEVHLKMEEMLDIMESVENIICSVDKLTNIMQEPDDTTHVNDNESHTTDMCDINQTFVKEVYVSSNSTDDKAFEAMHVNENETHTTGIIGDLNQTFVKEDYKLSNSNDDKEHEVMHVNENNSHTTNIVGDINQTSFNEVYESSDSSVSKVYEVKKQKPITIIIQMEDPKVGRKVDRPILHDAFHYLRKKITKKKEPKRTRLYFQRIESENGTSFLPIESFEDLRDIRDTSYTSHNGRYILGNYAQKKPSKFRRFFNYLNCASNDQI